MFLSRWKLNLEYVFAESYNPGFLLEAFVRDVGMALGTVNRLDLCLDSNRESKITVTLLGRELSMLVAACFSLKTLSYCGHLCPEIMKALFTMCPHISAFNVQVNTQDLQQMHEALPQLSSLLLNLTSLSIKCDTPITKLPDLSQCPSIQQLDLGHFEFDSNEQWRCMPAKLRCLKCGAINIGPTTPLPSLQFIESYWVGIPLNALAQVISASPSLATLSTWSDKSKDEMYVTLSLDHSTAESLHVLAESSLPFLRDVFYMIDNSKNDATDLEIPSIIASLPQMRGVTRCEIQDCHTADLGPLIRVFPHMSRLTLCCMSNMDDVDLQLLDTCPMLAHLELRFCSMVTAIGVFSLCQRLPKLGMISSDCCIHLTEKALLRCKILLGRELDIMVTTEDAPS